jgi:RimJ/RimL family protein N-acetyltransferase
MLKFQRRVLETNRLLLQPYDIKYYREVFALIQQNKDRLVQSFPKLLKATETQESTKDFTQYNVFDWNKNRAYGFMVFDKSTQTLIGHFNIKDIDWKNRQAELAYFIDTAYEGKGLMAEAIQTMLTCCFKEILLERIMVRIVTTNTPSIRLAEKCGLKYEGSFYKDYTTYDLQTVDTYRYGISKEQYPADKAD